MRKCVATDKRDEVAQIVFPKIYRLQVLQLVHDHALSGHLEITKT